LHLPWYGGFRRTAVDEDEAVRGGEGNEVSAACIQYSGLLLGDEKARGGRDGARYYDL
jgi:hypothetical protein